MSKFFDAVTKIVTKGKKENDQDSKDPAKVKKNSKDTDDKRVIKQVEKKRNAAKNTALLALNDIAKKLESYNKNLTPSDTVKSATKIVIEEIGKLKEAIKQMTPETLVPILEEQKEKWLDEKTVKVEGENFAQMELDKSEIYKRRKMAAKRCEKAIEILAKEIEEEKKK